MSHNEHSLENGPPTTNRRVFLAASLGVIAAGCASPQVARLPGPDWGHQPPTPVPSTPAPAPAPSTGDLPAHVLRRNQWSGGDPVPSLMNRMLPVQWITVHHDGMNVFTGVDKATSAQRIELIRRSHRNKGWGDIGYHFAIDRGGRVWQCRAMQWQGAHVKDCNPGNVGVVMLGNFQSQSPSQSQTNALKAHLAWLMGAYNVPVGKVRTHQEWPSARTECPGRTLQAFMVGARRSGVLV